MSDEGQRVRGLPPIVYMLLALPGGVCAGFVGVELSYMLRHNGVSVAVIAGLLGLALLPQTWKFVIGPLLDMSLSSKRWYVIWILALVVDLLAIAMTPPTSAAAPLLGILALIGGTAAAAAGISITAAMATTTPNARRGAVAGWLTVGNLGGSGVGGGAGLWLAIHAGGPIVSASVLSVVCLLAASPVLWLRVPPRAPGVPLTDQARALGRDIWMLLKTRRGALSALVVVIPAALGAAGNLFAAVAGDWHASADMVAGVTGVLGGLATAPGSVIGGYLCDRLPRRIVYIWAALACAAGEAAMAWAPHTPLWFAVMVLSNSFLLGVAFSALSALIFECLGVASAATTYALLGSLSNLPLVVMMSVVGWVQTKQGSTNMLLTEAAIAVVSIAAYAALAYLWQPEEQRRPKMRVAGAKA
jgi:MFS family permease